MLDVIVACIGVVSFILFVVMVAADVFWWILDAERRDSLLDFLPFVVMILLTVGLYLLSELCLEM